jgi:hypothetical protein
MSNPIKAIIILKEDSGGGGGGSGCGALIIIAIMIFGLNFLDWGALQVFGGGALILLAWLWFEEGGAIIATIVIFGGMWGCGKLLEEDEDSKGTKSTQEIAVEKEKLENHNKWKKEYYENKENRDAKTKENAKSDDTQKSESFGESVKKLNSILQGKITQDKNSNSEVTSTDKPNNIDFLNGNKSEHNPSNIIESIDLSSIDYPSSFLTTADSQFLAADGKETVIPANTRITIIKRTPAGMLTLEANGKNYLGYESRLKSKLIKPD